MDRLRRVLSLGGRVHPVASAAVVAVAIGGGAVTAVATGVIEPGGPTPATAAPIGVSATDEESVTVGTRCEGAGAGGWRFEAFISANDGLVLERSSIDGRLVTKRISIPYAMVETSTAERPSSGGGSNLHAWTKFELTPELPGRPKVARGTRLVDYECEASGDTDIFVRAVYEVPSLADPSSREVQGDRLQFIQEYRFRANDGRPCEPTATVSCVRFWPTAAYRFDGPVPDVVPPIPNPSSGVPNVETFFQNVQLVQRIELAPDGSESGSIDAFQDFDPARGGVGKEPNFALVKTKGSGSDTHSSMKREDTDNAIRGGAAGDWDSIHQSPTDHTSLPGINPFHLGAGCRQCVHIHWRWSTFANLASGPGSDFADGSLQLHPGSRQTTEFGMVRFVDDPDEIDPVVSGWRSLVAAENDPGGSLEGRRPVLFWEMTSPAASDSTFPVLTDSPAGGNASIFVPVGSSSGVPIDQPSVDVHLFLIEFLDAWWTGSDRLPQYVEPGAIEPLEPRSRWATHQLEWDDLTCRLGTSRNGECDVMLTMVDGTHQAGRIRYGEVDATGRLLIDGVELDAGGHDDLPGPLTREVLVARAREMAVEADGRAVEENSDPPTFCGQQPADFGITWTHLLSEHEIAVGTGSTDSLLQYLDSTCNGASTWTGPSGTIWESTAYSRTGDDPVTYSYAFRRRGHEELFPTTFVIERAGDHFVLVYGTPDAAAANAAALVSP